MKNFTINFFQAIRNFVNQQFIAKRQTKSLIKLVLACVSLTSVAAEQAVYQLKTVITGIDVPWGMVQFDNGDFLVSEREGELYFVEMSKGKKTKVKGLPDISSSGQGGLLDLELHPDYRKNGWIYFSYSSSEGKGWGSNTAIMRARLKDHTLVDKELLYKALPNSVGGRHFGSRIEFDRAGYLYFSIGDRGDRDTNPQNISLDGGKIYRLHDDGRIPEDNPFVKNEKAKAAIFSYGHRNPQGMEMNPSTGVIWTHEHGPRGGDEVNIVEKGKNYGWPVVSFGINYSGSKFTELTEKKGMEQPVWYWVPSIAPSGMTFVTGDKYPQLSGHLLVGSLKFNYIVLCQLDGNKVTSQQILFEGVGRVRNVKQMPDGFIYIATENNKIVKVIPKKT
ncbi:PQQ-dependent sugar dehydrogenase [Aliikangiella coralliicola]|uniref:PQQ-dependent sugar dehydrogenase n=1 Tax=Aliikangiella coralliicola TaxID=2592383 RepID=A0A545UHB9_9GAMM|nr:PQQ-dependent sugar dehydrogenase [Aliikangiella coralliicola]TQV88858.1 PQQ-dependent sugar dehydrogenase [Aliikangiella coralliicola]